MFHPNVHPTLNLVRSHGRPSKMVVVKGKCSRLKKDHLKYTVDTAPSLCELPFFHMFWTDCQVCLFFFIGVELCLVV